MVKKWVGSLAQIYLEKVLLFVLTPVKLVAFALTLSYQLGPKSSRLVHSLYFGHYDIIVTFEHPCHMLPSGQVSILGISIFPCGHFLSPEESFSQEFFPRISIFLYDVLAQFSDNTNYFWASGQGQGGESCFPAPLFSFY
jgi:hypothetical protein